MAVAIYYFKDKTVEVGKVDWVSAEDEQYNIFRNDHTVPQTG